MDASDLPSRYDSVDARIPRTWDELHGPADGEVHLPNRLAWSGPDTFDLSNPRQRLTLYSIVLDCGQRDDAAALMNPLLLRELWSQIRRLTTREITSRWERRLPELLTSRPSRDIDFATAATRPLPQVTDRLADAYRNHGYAVTLVESTPRMARLVVIEGEHGCEVDLLREAIGPPVLLEIGPVLHLDDAVGLKVRALYDRALHRDFIDVHAAHGVGYSWERLENLGRRFLPSLRLDDLAQRLGSIELRDEETFVAYGLGSADIEALTGWALQWADDINQRLLAHPEPELGPEPDWDTYLDGLE